MIKGKHFSIITKSIIALVLFAFTFTTVYAANISLSGIDVDQNPENNEYTIFVKTDKKVNIKTQTNGNNKLTVLLNSTLPADSLEIVYDDAPDMANVIVQKKNKNNTLILFEGNNISKAHIYNNDLSTGLVKPIHGNGILNNIFFITDKKTLTTSVAGLIIFFFMMLISRPKERRYNTAKSNNARRQRNAIRANTLRNKNLAQTGNIPSIASNSNGSFNSAQMYMSKPADLTVNEQYEEEEEIRKAG